MSQSSNAWLPAEFSFPIFFLPRAFPMALPDSPWAVRGESPPGDHLMPTFFFAHHESGKVTLEATIKAASRTLISWLGPRTSHPLQPGAVWVGVPPLTSPSSPFCGWGALTPAPHGVLQILPPLHPFGGWVSSWADCWGHCGFLQGDHRLPASPACTNTWRLCGSQMLLPLPCPQVALTRGHASAGMPRAALVSLP